MQGQESPEPRQGLANLTRSIRRYKLTFAVITIVVFAGFLAKSLTSPKLYTANAVVLFQDPSQDLALIGDTGVVVRTAQESAQIGANTLINRQLATQAQHDIGSSLSVTKLMSDLSATADPSSSQVTITATGPSAQFVAALANAAASIGATTQATQERARYQAAARSLQQRLARLGKSSNDHNQRLIYGDQIARLRTLSVLAQPVQVIASATPPGSPSSPKPVSDGIQGLLLGVILGLIGVLARAAMDRRLRSAEDIEQALALPILAQLGAEALGKAGLSKSGLGALSEAEFEAVRILRAKLHLRGTVDGNGAGPPKTILVTSPMPKEGKSTVAASLAYGYAVAGQTTLLIECDFRHPSLAERLGVKSRPGLIEFLLGDVSPPEVLQAVPVSESHAAAGSQPNTPAGSAPFLAAIVAGSQPNAQPAELLETSDFKQFLREVSQAYDVVVIDTAPLLPVADTLELIDQVDSILMCVRSSQTTRDQARAALASLAPARENVLGVVVTGVASSERGYYGYYGYYGYGGSNGDAEDPGQVADGRDDLRSEPRRPRRLRVRLPILRG